MPALSFRGLRAALFVLAGLVLSLAGSAEAASDGPLAVTARGAWSATVNYVKDDLVLSRGSTWRAKRPNTNKLPGSTTPSTAADWELFAAGYNFLGGWDAGKRYDINDLVTRLGATWRAKNTSTGKAPESNSANWIKFADRGAVGPAGPSAVSNGTLSTPALRFTSSTNTGIFSPSTGKIALVEGGILFLHNIGTGNTALGRGALAGNNSGSENTALGLEALSSNTLGDSNTAIGHEALELNDEGSNNTALGAGALANNTGGDSNTALGVSALESNETGVSNTAVGRDAMLNDAGSSSNVAIGYQALQSGGGGNSTAVGVQALPNNDEGGDNVALGFQALFSNTDGSSNIAVGYGALSSNTEGSGNIAIGRRAGADVTPSPVNSIFIGNLGAASDTTTIKIGTQGTQDDTFIAGIVGATTGENDAIAVLIDSNGQLGTASSSRRYKEDIAPMSAMSEMLAKLRPVSFRYIKPYADGSKPIQYGMIAEEVAEAFPYLAVFNGKGQPETVKYHLLPTFLLKGFQEQQKTIAVQAAEIAGQLATIEAQEKRISEMEVRLAAIEAQLGNRGFTTASNRP